MKSPRLVLRPLLVSAAMVGAAMVAMAAPEGFQYAFTMKFTGYAGTTTLENFPVLVKVSENNGSGFLYSRCQTNGGDLRFYDEADNLLPSEIETWDPSGTSYVWVRVPTLTASTKITAYYGYNGNATLPAVTASDVWANGFVAVWHLNAEETSSTQNDSTTNDLVLTKYAGLEAAITNGEVGVVGTAASFNNNASHFGGYTLTDTGAKLSGFNAFTIELWTYQNDHNPEDVVRPNYMLRCYGNSSIYNLYEYFDSSTGAGNGKTVFEFYREGYSSATIYASDSVAKPPRDTWNHHVVRFDGVEGSRYGFLNGTQIYKSSSGKEGTLSSVSDATFILGNYSVGSGNCWLGKMDEVRISNVARSDDWMKATYDTVKTAGFATYEEIALKNDWTKFSHRFTVTFDGYTGEETLTSFPVLVKLSEGSPTGFRYADCLKPNGGDLRFADEHGNVLPSEVELWDTTGTSYVWVGVPSLDTSTKITAYYGWALALDVTASDVWTNGYVAVWHLNAATNATTQADSTANALTLTEMPYQTQTYVTPGVKGAVGYCALFGIDASSQGSYGRDDSIDHALTGFGAYTFEVWSWQNSYDLADSSGPYFMRYCEYNDRNAEAYRFKDLEGSGKTILYAYGDASSYEIYPNDDKPFPARNAWNYHAVAIDSARNTRRIFLNGDNLKSSTGVAALKTPNGHFWLGNSHCWDSRAYPGKLDEVRISNVARSDDWVKATYDTIMTPGFAMLSSARDNTSGIVILMR